MRDRDNRKNEKIRQPPELFRVRVAGLLLAGLLFAGMGAMVMRAVVRLVAMSRGLVALHLRQGKVLLAARNLLGIVDDASQFLGGDSGRLAAAQGDDERRGRETATGGAAKRAKTFSKQTHGGNAPETHFAGD